MLELRSKYRILVAPLDWGLGHATRCIPVIRELMDLGCEVWLAGEGVQAALLKSEFPTLPFLPLQGYRVRYSKSSKGFFFKIMSQLPKIVFSIKKEHKWLKKQVKTHDFDGILADNRFGLYHKKVPGIFITHQLTIKSPLGEWSERIIQSWNYRYINRFTECWVPDLAGENNLAGELSHPEKKPSIPVRYLGLLSRFKENEAVKKEGHLLFILSGPEPQRTILEDKIVNEISHYSGTATIIRGLPSSLSIIPSTEMIKFYNHLPAEELNEEMQKADWVISRCGYSTVMDIVKLGKKSILFPTPGQTEQEYLAKYLKEKNIAFTIQLKDVSLNDVLEQAKKFNYQSYSSGDTDALKKAITAFIGNQGMKITH